MTSGLQRPGECLAAILCLLAKGWVGGAAACALEMGKVKENQLLVKEPLKTLFVHKKQKLNIDSFKSHLRYALLQDYRNKNLK